MILGKLMTALARTSSFRRCEMWLAIRYLGQAGGGIDWTQPWENQSQDTSQRSDRTFL